MAKSKGNVNRRKFLKGAAAGAAASAVTAVTVVTGVSGAAEPLAPQTAAQQATLPTQGQLAREAGSAPPPVVSRHIENPGSDYMVDVFKALGIEYVAANPGSSFEGLQESFVNYGGNAAPEFLTCLHEESAVAMAHGWAKIELKPTFMPLLHGVIGLQHASMAVYNAYCDRVPLLMTAGLDYVGAVAAHNATDMAALIRGYVKWDNQPTSIGQFPNAALRAYRLAATPPTSPVMLVVEGSLQKNALATRPPLPKLTLPMPPSADIGSLREAARQLVAAENPKITAGRLMRTPKAIDLLVELAELLAAPVNSGTDRVNFPSRHPLAGVGTGSADLVLSLEGGPGGQAAGAKTIAITAAELLPTSNYNVLGNAPQADLLVQADGEASLPGLIEEVKRQLTADRRRVIEERRAKHIEANNQARMQIMSTARLGWDASPISLARLSAELWALIKNEDWSLVSPQGFISNWPNRLWNMDKHYRHTGGRGGEGMGYGAPAAVGAALANRKYGRLSINIQQDGDLNYAPGVLWTAVHHKIPLLTVMHDNRGYHQEVMFLQQQAAIRNRRADTAHIGNRLIEPNIDYKKMAEGYGMYAEGPITDPNQLAAVLKRGIDRVKGGEPVLIHTVTQPR